MEKYIGRPSHQIVCEITKRGRVRQRKDETGQVQKKTNPYGPNSMFGWGAVEITIPTLKKDLENVRKNLKGILNQITPHHLCQSAEMYSRSITSQVMPRLPPQPLKRPREHEEVQQQNKVAKVVQDWYNAWANEHKIGNIGLVPEAYQGEPLMELEEVWQCEPTLQHFCGFLRNLY